MTASSECQPGLIAAGIESSVTWVAITLLRAALWHMSKVLLDLSGLKIKKERGKRKRKKKKKKK